MLRSLVGSEMCIRDRFAIALGSIHQNITNHDLTRGTLRGLCRIAALVIYVCSSRYYHDRQGINTREAPLPSCSSALPHHRRHDQNHKAGETFEYRAKFKLIQPSRDFECPSTRASAFNLGDARLANVVKHHENLSARHSNCQITTSISRPASTCTTGFGGARNDKAPSLPLCKRALRYAALCEVRILQRVRRFFVPADM